MFHETFSVKDKVMVKRLKDLEANHNNVMIGYSTLARQDPGENPPALQRKPLAPLNEQELAVRAALNAPDVFLIQGPPGTGKLPSYGLSNHN